MNKSLFICLFLCFSVFSQDNYQVSFIEKSFKENASSVVNDERIDVQILAVDKYTIKTKRVITVFSENGLDHLNFNELYDKSTKIKRMQVTQLDAQGKLIKVFKQKDFKDYSLSQGMSITDSRVQAFEFRPVQYPVVFIYESEIESRNTAFLPKWQPIQYYSQSILSSTFTIENSSGINSTPVLYNPNFTKVDKTVQGSKVIYTVKDFKAVTNESYTPNAKSLLPTVITTLDKVSLEGIKGEFTNWEQLGTWYYSNFVKGTETLNTEVVDKAKELTSGVTEDIAKAKILYEYMQSHTRYISIQLGIGGWKPMLANDVNRLNYGDCKGLSNYYRALLKAVGVESYPVVVHGSSTPVDIREESVCLQGNHMFIAIPLKNGGYQWVECTNNQKPFGFIGGFTDNRKVLVVKEYGSEVVSTKTYSAEESTQVSYNSYLLKPNGDIEATIDIISKGIQFDSRAHMFYANSTDKEKYYKRMFSAFTINQFSTLNVLINSKDISLEEKISFIAPKYATKLGNRLVFSLNAWNASNITLTSSKNRKQPLYISSSWKDIDTIEVVVPDGYSVDNLPDNISLVTKYGEYKVTYEAKVNKIYCTRYHSVNGGMYTIEEYDLFKQYREDIIKYDQAKIVLKLNQ